MKAVKLVAAYVLSVSIAIFLVWSFIYATFNIVEWGVEGRSYAAQTWVLMSVLGSLNAIIIARDTEDEK